MTLEPTGERYLPEYDADWTLEHVHRYLIACGYAEGKDVLDIACGEGYGSRMLADAAASVTGIDISLEAVAQAKEKYTHPRLAFLQGSIVAIPLADASVDLVTSFETIEHISEHEEMLREIRRVLRPGGMLVISSPDKYQYSDLTGYKNAYHVKELYRDEFTALLKNHFPHLHMAGQRIVFGSVLGSEDAQAAFLSWNKHEQGPPATGLAEAEYLVALASDSPLPPLPSGILKTPVEESNLARQLKKEAEDSHAHLTRLQAWEIEARNYIALLEGKNRELEDHAATLKTHVQELDLDVRLLDAYRQELEDERVAIYASHSWRVTAPFRHAANCARRLLGRPLPGAGAPTPVWPPDVCCLEKKLLLARDARPSPPQIGVFLHIYYTDLAGEMLNCIRRLPDNARIHISTDTEAKQDVLAKEFAQAGLEERTEIRVCPNRGWDLAPFLVGFADAIPRYPLILRLHSKRSTFIPGDVGEKWRRMLFSSLAGNPGRVTAILAAFEQDPKLGMVCPPIIKYYTNSLGFGKNFRLMRKLLHPHGIHITPGIKIDFPMGTMFWCRSEILSPWLEKRFSYDDFNLTLDNERDGTLAHALERLFFFGCGISGYSWARVPALPETASRAR